MSNEAFVRLLRHPCSQGLTEEAVREISAAMTLVDLAEGEYLHRAGTRLDCLYLVVKGRIKRSLIDIHGEELVQQFLASGQQFGALAAAQVEPVPLNAVATEPATVLRIDYEKAIELSRKHPTFHLNILRIIGNELTKSLFVDRVRFKPSSIAIVHESPSSRKLTRRLLARLVELEGSACVLSDDPDWKPMQNVEFCSTYDNDQLISQERVLRLLKQWANRGRIVVDASQVSGFEWLSRVFNFADEVFWCVDADNFARSTEIIQKLQRRVEPWLEKISLVWLLEGDHAIAPNAPELMEMVTRDFKVSFEPPGERSGKQLLNGLERIIHHLRGIRIGIALGGGGAKGMAHLGVLAELEKNGIVVDMIAGTSAGAMTGIWYAYGMESDYSIRSFKNDLTPSWFFRCLPNGGYWYLLYKYRTSKFDSMMRRYIKDVRIEQLPIPIHAVTVDLVSGEPVVRSTGDAIHGILESINLPVLSAPICRPGMALVDGGLVDNVPADLLLRQGCNFVIAVSVTAQLEKEFAGMKPDSKTKSRRAPSTMQTIMRSFMVQHVNMNSVGVQPSDVVIEPDVLEFGLTEFMRTDELAAAGARATTKAIPEIRRLLFQLDKQLFPADKGNPH